MYKEVITLMRDCKESASAILFSIPASVRQTWNCFKGELN